MKSEMLQRAMTMIDDDLLEASERNQATTKKNTGKTIFLLASGLAACLAVVGVVLAMPMMKVGDPAEGTIGAVTTPSIAYNDGKDHTGEDCIAYSYKYAVDSGKYAAYEGGKAINKTKVGEKLCDVTVTAGWVNVLAGTWNANEHARAEIYEIKGVSPDVAVAIVFLDKLEAEVVGMNYVIINPAADPAPVQEYVIPKVTDPAQNEGAVEE